MGYFIYAICFPIIVLVSAESNLPTDLQDYMSTEFFPKTNVITCNKNENINLIKMLSTGFQRFVAFYSADKALMPFLHDTQRFVLDLQCPKAATVLRQADSLGLFSKPFHWLLLANGVTGNFSYEAENFSDRQLSSASGETWYWPFLETLSILTDNDVKVMEKASDERITVTGAYKLGKAFLKEPLVEWTSEGGFVFLNNKSVASRRWNLQGLHIPSSTVITQPDSLKHLEDLVDTQIDTPSKVTYNMVKLLGELLNANITFKIEKEWGAPRANGSWSGMVGDLERKEIEIGGAPLFIQARRLHILEYFTPVATTSSKFLFLAPPLSYSSNIFALPFHSVVWICCFSMVAISSGFLYAALNYENTHTNGNQTKVSFSEILVFNIGAICQQGTVAQTKNPPGRIFTLFLYLSYMFLYISYSASIVAILQSSDTSIQTLADFLKSPMKAGAEDIVYFRDFIKAVEGEVRQAIYNKKIAPKGEPPHFLSVADGVKELRKGFYGFHVEVSAGFKEIQRTFTEEEKCGLQVLPESFFVIPEPFVAMRKGSPFAEHFKVGMDRCLETGFKNRFGRRYFTKKPVCSAKGARFVSVGIVDCYWAFMVLGSGMITAFLIMLLEITRSKYVENRKKRKNLRRMKTYTSYTLPGIEYFN